MALQTFTPPVDPSIPSGLQVEFRALNASFGDGYEQRAVDGINARRETWSLVWEVLRTTESDQITAFLDARGNSEAFLYTPPGEGSPRKFRCAGYQRRYHTSLIVDLSATLTEVFDL